MKHHESYYSVRVEMDEHTYVHTVLAPSDYAAAIKVKQITGHMPRSDHDVAFLSAEVEEENSVY